MVGMEAERIRSPEPTMMLNLKGHKPELQRSLVIHEFGHALGLEHEHQNSDFCKTLESYIDFEKMKHDRRLLRSTSETFDEDWIEKCKKSIERKKSEYDAKSIMRYW